MPDMFSIDFECWYSSTECLMMILLQDEYLLTSKFIVMQLSSLLLALCQNKFSNQHIERLSGVVIVRHFQVFSPSFT